MKRLLTSLILNRWTGRPRTRRVNSNTASRTPMIVSFDGRVVRLRQPD
jgi:hypothetical protein